MQRPLIAPSVLAADFGRLREQIAMVNASEADWLHLDVMDGRFVPNISFGFPIIDAIQKEAKLPLDIHLMIVEPELYIDRFVDAGAEVLTVHAEACTHLHRTLGAIREAGAKAGVALNPHTPVHVLEDIICDADLVCLMTVNPGYGGQKFIEHSYKKLAKLKALIRSSGSSALIEIDGGVGPGNAAQLVETGADVLVAGSSVFASADPIKTIAALKHLSPESVDR